MISTSEHPLAMPSKRALREELMQGNEGIPPTKRTTTGCDTPPKADAYTIKSSHMPETFSSHQSYSYTREQMSGAYIIQTVPLAEPTKKRSHMAHQQQQHNSQQRTTDEFQKALNQDSMENRETPRTVRDVMLEQWTHSMPQSHSLGDLQSRFLALPRASNLRNELPGDLNHLNDIIEANQQVLELKYSNMVSSREDLEKTIEHIANQRYIHGLKTQEAMELASRHPRLNEKLFVYLYYRFHSLHIEHSDVKYQTLFANWMRYNIEFHIILMRHDRKMQKALREDNEEEKRKIKVEHARNIDKYTRLLGEPYSEHLLFFQTQMITLAKQGTLDEQKFAKSLDELQNVSKIQKESTNSMEKADVNSTTPTSQPSTTVSLSAAEAQLSLGVDTNHIPTPPSTSFNSPAASFILSLQSSTSQSATPTPPPHSFCPSVSSDNDLLIYYTVRAIMNRPDHTQWADWLKNLSQNKTSGKEMSITTSSNPKLAAYDSKLHNSALTIIERLDYANWINWLSELSQKRTEIEHHERVASEATDLIRTVKEEIQHDSSSLNFVRDQVKEARTEIRKQQQRLRDLQKRKRVTANKMSRKKKLVEEKEKVLTEANEVAKGIVEEYDKLQKCRFQEEILAQTANQDLELNASMPGEPIINILSDSLYHPVVPSPSNSLFPSVSLIPHQPTSSECSPSSSTPSALTLPNLGSFPVGLAGSPPLLQNTLPIDPAVLLALQANLLQTNLLSLCTLPATSSEQSLPVDFNNFSTVPPNPIPQLGAALSLPTPAVPYNPFLAFQEKLFTNDALPSSSLSTSPLNLSVGLPSLEAALQKGVMAIPSL